MSHALPRLVGELEQHLVDARSAAGFLEDEDFEQLRAKRIREFADASSWEPRITASRKRLA